MSNSKHEVEFKVLKKPKLALLVVSAIRKEASLSHQPLKNVKQSLQRGYYIFAVSSAKKQNIETTDILGWIEVVPVTKNWYAIFSLYITEPNRGQGLASALLTHILEIYNNKSLYIAVSSTKLKKWCLKRGFQEKKIWNVSRQLTFQIFVRRWLNAKNFVKLIRLNQKTEVTTLFRIVS